MRAKDFFGQAYLINQRIHSLTYQLDDLQKIQRETSEAYTNDAPPVKLSLDMLDLEDALTGELTALVQLKKDMREAISKLSKTEYRIILEMRYLCSKTWEEIADDMGYGVRYVHILHRKAMTAVEPFIKY